MNGFLKSSSVNPTARHIARAAACLFPPLIKSLRIPLPYLFPMIGRSREHFEVMLLQQPRHRLALRYAIEIETAVHIPEFDTDRFAIRSVVYVAGTFEVRRHMIKRSPLMEID